MNLSSHLLIILFLGINSASCKKRNSDIQSLSKIETKPLNINLIKLNENIVNQSFIQLLVNKFDLILNFSEAIDRNSVIDACKIINLQNSSILGYNFQFSNQDSSLIIHLKDSLAYLTRYKLQISTRLKSITSQTLSTAYQLEFKTGIDAVDKFPRISDDALLDKIQRETFKYFWDYGHPSGLARDKTDANDLEDCSVGGTGFGIMTIPIAINRGFINRKDGLDRMNKIVDFLTNKAEKFHGAFPHRINGSTGKVIEWAPGDNGADLVETSFLMMGLLTARQYFSSDNLEEKLLREHIYNLYNNVDWNWFNKDQSNGLYWLWSPNFEWKHSFLIRGWNETLIAYILAAGSPTHSITKEVYEKGYANYGGLKNGNTYFDINLPLGEPFGGPLFLSQYTFLGINPTGLKDQYADYQVQTRNHSLINQAYCKANPKGYLGYSDSYWGLTACSTNSGYKVCSPTNDIGVIAPTASLSSFAFTPQESMKALHFFYYKLGDLLWDKYGFADAVNLNADPVWVGHEQLVYNQLPIMIAIENYRTGLLWQLFSAAPEVKSGLKKLQFTAPYLP